MGMFIAKSFFKKNVKVIGMDTDANFIILTLNYLLFNNKIVLVIKQIIFILGHQKLIQLLCRMVIVLKYVRYIPDT